MTGYKETPNKAITPTYMFTRLSIIAENTKEQRGLSTVDPENLNHPLRTSSHKCNSPGLF